MQSSFGGAEVDLYLLATELTKDERFDVRFVVADYGQPDGEKREGVTIYKSVKTDKFMIAEGWKVWQALKRADADVYMHEACSLGTALIAAFCRLYKRGFVYRTASSLEADGTYSRKKPLRGIFVNWAFKQAIALIVQNQQDAEQLRQRLGIEAVVIRNACRIRPLNAAGKEGGLWVGRSEWVKRPDLFLKLAAALPDIPFTMICQRATGDNRYDELVRKARAIRNLKFLERVPFQEVDSYFERSVLFVNTSDSEGFPNTFVQACKAGTAILSLNVNPDAFLDKHHCGFCARGEWDAFKNQLTHLMTGSNALQLGANGRAYVEAHHNLEIIIREYKRLFERTVK